MHLFRKISFLTTKIELFHSYFCLFSRAFLNDYFSGNKSVQLCIPKSKTGYIGWYTDSNRLVGAWKGLCIRLNTWFFQQNAIKVQFVVYGVPLHTHASTNTVFSLEVRLWHALISIIVFLGVRLSHAWRFLRPKSHLQKFLCISLIKKLRIRTLFKQW